MSCNFIFYTFYIKCEIIYKLNKKCKYSDDIYFILVYDRKINKNIIPKFFIWYQIEQFNTSISLIPKFEKFTYNLMNKALFVCDFDENNINTETIKFYKPQEKGEIKMIDSDNLDELINLLHNEAKVI